MNIKHYSGRYGWHHAALWWSRASWRDWPWDYHKESGIFKEPRAILFYTVRVPYNLGTDWTKQPFEPELRGHKEFGNAINLSRFRSGYRVGPPAPPGMYWAMDGVHNCVGGPAAWRNDGHPHPDYEPPAVKWADGRQVPRRIMNKFAGYRDLAVEEILIGSSH